MLVQASGSITIIDVTDIGEFSVSPMSSLPLSVIYDPNQNSYAPDWGTSNLTLTPMVYYAGRQLDLGTNGLLISWKRQVGTNAQTTLTTGETNRNGVLTVNRNKFTPTTSMITYIVTANYTDPSSGNLLTSQGQITFSLIKMASSVKSCIITGENIFKYNTDGQLVGDDHIQISASLSGVNPVAWQYKNANGDFVNYPLTTGNNEAINTDTLNVYANEDVFFNDRAIIKLTTTDAEVYDVINIIKLRDGASGSNNVSVVLSNESQMIPCDGSGNILTGGLDTAYTFVKIYEGGQEQTDWTITPSATNVTGSWNSSEKKYTVTGISANVGYVDFVCTKNEYNGAITKRFSLTKVKTGADGKSPTIYSLDVSAIAINRGTDGSLNPSTVTLHSYSQVDTTKSNYSGRFKIFVDDSSDASYSSASNQNTYTINMNDYASANHIRIDLYNTSMSKVLDSQTIVFVDDGVQGEQGVEGAAAVNVVLGNYADSISVNNSFKLNSDLTITIPFSAYEGTRRIACTCTASQLFGVNATVTQGTVSTDGSVIYRLLKSSNKALGTDTTLNGSILLSFTATTSNGTKVNKTERYSYSLNKQSLDGVNAIMLQLQTPNGYEFRNGSGTLQVKGYLTDGTDDITSNSGITWKWYKFINGNYVQITSSNANGVTGYTTSTLSVVGTSVDGYASYKCEITYNSKSHIAYSYLYDRTDPLQVTLISTIGEQIKNGNGVGVVYPRVIRNGEELDALPNNITFVEEKPQTLINGDYYYLMDKTTKTVSLYKATSTTSWSAATYTYTGTYRWSYRDKNNEAIPSSKLGKLATTGRLIYIDSELVNDKIIIDIEVTI